MEWRKFLTIATEHLSTPSHTEPISVPTVAVRPERRSWCSWTTFDRLYIDCGYWAAELPETTELTDTNTTDGGTWGQPFPYRALAHLMIPRYFSEEYSPVFTRGRNPGYWLWKHTQDIDGLSKLLTSENIDHRLNEYVLEVKLF